MTLCKKIFLAHFNSSRNEGQVVKNDCSETQIDTIVSVYHSCHRALVRAAKRQEIACVNYVDLVAERAERAGSRSIRTLYGTRQRGIDLGRGSRLLFTKG